MTTDWSAYFDGLQPDSPLHAVQARVYVDSLRTMVGVRDPDRVLDFGCGFGLVTARLAPLVREAWWWEPSPNMRAVAERSTAELPNAHFCDLSTLARDGAVRPEWPGPPFDMILVNSVVQYMAPDTLWQWLPRWRLMLVPGGKVVLSDLIRPDRGGLSDIVDLLRFGVHHGAPARAVSDAVGGVARYWRTRRAAPLTQVGEDDLAMRAAQAGLELNALPRNLTHLRSRWTAVLRRV